MPAHRRSVSALSLFHRYYHGYCSDEIKSIIPPKASFARNTRFSKIQHPYALKLDTYRTNVFANSFIHMTSREWNSLSPTVFTATYNHQSPKTRIHRYLRLLPNPFYFHDTRAHRELQKLYLFTATSSCISL